MWTYWHPGQVIGGLAITLLMVYAIVMREMDDRVSFMLLGLFGALIYRVALGRDRNGDGR